MKPYTLSLLVVLLSAVNGGETQVELRTENSVLSGCHTNITLHCTIMSKHSESSVVKVLWQKGTGETLCSGKTSNGEHSDPRIQCHYTPEKLLSLTISNVTEDDRGKYTCKLFTIFNHTRADTTLDVSECHSELSETILGTYSVKSDNNQASPLQNKWTFLVLIAFLLTL